MESLWFIFFEILLWMINFYEGFDFGFFEGNMEKVVL